MVLKKRIDDAKDFELQCRRVATREWCTHDQHHVEDSGIRELENGVLNGCQITIAVLTKIPKLSYRYLGLMVKFINETFTEA